MIFIRLEEKEAKQTRYHKTVMVILYFNIIKNIVLHAFNMRVLFITLI